MNSSEVVQKWGFDIYKYNYTYCVTKAAIHGHNIKNAFLSLCFPDSIEVYCNIVNLHLHVSCPVPVLASKYMPKQLQKAVLMYTLHVCFNYTCARAATKVCVGAKNIV